MSVRLTSRRKECISGKPPQNFTSLISCVRDLYQSLNKNKVSQFSAVVQEFSILVNLNDVGVEEKASSHHVSVSRWPADSMYAVLFTAAPLCYF